MKKPQESTCVDVYLANSLLSSMNEKLLGVTPDKKEAVQTVMFAIAEEIFAALNIAPSTSLIKLTKENKLKSFKLLSSHSTIEALSSLVTIPCQESTASPKFLKERIIAACARKEILILLTEDSELLVPILRDILQLIDHTIAVEEKQIIDYWKYDLSKTHKFNISHDALYSKHEKMTLFSQKKYDINPMPKLNKDRDMSLYYALAYNQHKIIDQFFHQQKINLFHPRYDDFLANLKRLLKANLTVVRFLLVLVDNDGNRFMPLTQLNLVAVCTAISNHDNDLQINTGRLERLYYLCSESKRFSCQVLNWMRMYVQHCTANELPISFPELLLTYCANFPEQVDDKGPLPLKTMCAKVVRDKIPRHQVPYVVALEMADEENVMPNGIGDDQEVVALLADLINEGSKLCLIPR